VKGRTQGGREWRSRLASVAWLAFALLPLPVLTPARAQGAPGDLDPSFGNGGQVTTPFPGGAWASSTAIDPKGRILVTGGSDCRKHKPGAGCFALARYRPDGSLDGSFGGEGKVATHFQGGAGAGSVALDSMGRIVVAGTRGSGSEIGFAVARYRTNGKLDHSFGGDGKVNTRLRGNATANSVTCDPRNRIVVAGTNGGGFAIARYRPNGKLDRSFGEGGKVTTGFRPETGANAVAIDPGGRIVVAGSASDLDGFYSDFALARYGPNGSLDPSFGTGGKVITDLGGEDSANALAIESGGRIVAVGDSADIDGQSSVFSLAAYRSNGTPDPTFSGDGQETTRFNGYGAALGGGIDSQGRIVAAGLSRPGFALARYATNGDLDSSFGVGGKVTTHIGPDYSAIAEGMTFDSQDRIVTVGHLSRRIGTVGHVSRRFLVARYLG
jgi:uncharacterized delta-60 repeat protein